MNGYSLDLTFFCETMVKANEFDARMLTANISRYAPPPFRLIDGGQFLECLDFPIGHVGNVAFV